MLVLRLQRTGRKNSPAYRVVLAEKAKAVKGKHQEILGHYLPTREPVVFEVDQDKIKEWIQKGAIPSNTLARLLKNAGMSDMDKYIKTYAKKKKKKEEEEKADEAPAAAPAPETSEDTPAESAQEPTEEAPPAQEEKPAEEEKEPEKKDASKEDGDKEEKDS